jgi:hypothetical protein
VVKPEDQPHGGRLARAVRAQKAGDHAGSTEQVRSSTARVWPKTFVRPANSIIGTMISGCVRDDEVGDRSHAFCVGVQWRGPAGQRHPEFRRPWLY